MFRRHRAALEGIVSNASIFRRMARVEEQMIRAAMPRVAASDPEPLAAQARRLVVAARIASRLVKPLTYTLAETRHA